MADIDFSLDDYIKTKRKQGSGFKINAAKRGAQQKPRRGGKVSLAIRGRKAKQRGAGGGARGAGRQRLSIGQAARQSQKNQQQIRQNRQASWMRGRGGNRSRMNRGNNQQQTGRFNAVGGGGGQQRFNNRRNRRGGGGGGNLNNQFSGGSPRRRNNNRGGGGGISQHLARGNRQNMRGARAAGMQFLQSPRMGANSARYFGNRRAVLKIAKKKVQRARLQLRNPRRGFGTAIGRPLMPLLSLESGVRRVRNGFVTVKHPVEKQIQRLVIQEKIQKAALNRNNRNFGGNNNRQQVRQRQQPRQRAPPPQRQVFRPTEDRRYHDDFLSSRRPVSSNQYDPEYPEIPQRMGMGSMYADQEERRSGPSGMAARAQWNPPLVRTAINPTASSYQHQQTVNNNRSSNDDFDGGFQGLDPEIQRKINFIQSRTRHSDTSGILPDFRAPIASSAMKLGDRFKMYMQ